MTLSNQNKVIKGNNLQPSLNIENGWLFAVTEEVTVNQRKSNFYTPRSPKEKIYLLVVHNISLPSGEFGNNHITDLFLGKIDANAHPSFADIATVEVSAHCLIKRDGSIIQYVSFEDKAWHAGVSVFNGIEKCNDFSIGIELEGTDDIPYEEAQYIALAKLTTGLQQKYPLITNKNIVGHCDIAPGRKTDPGQVFNWRHFHNCLQKQKVNQ